MGKYHGDNERIQTILEGTVSLPMKLAESIQDRRK